MRGYLTHGDVDIFSFSVPEGGRVYRLQVLGIGEGLSGVTLSSASGGAISSAGADGGRARIASVELQQGDYYVAIEGSGSEYALRILDLAAAAAEPEQLAARADGDDNALAVTTVAYWTAPVYDPESPSLDPSRTVVDRNGNVWVGVPLQPGAVSVTARPDLVANSNAIEVILDASGSMGISLPSGQSRWDAATEVLLDLAENAFPTGVPLALRVYGHLEPATCHMALELPLEPFETERFQAAVLAVQPKLLSRTPLADSILAAGDDLADAQGRRMVLLITDGEESCGGDPEAAITALREAGISTVNIVGLALPDDEQVQATFAAWAELGGGVYYDTTTGEELAAAGRLESNVRRGGMLERPEALMQEPWAALQAL